MNNRPRAPLIQEIISRLSDYDRHEFLENRRKLIEKWHELHTEAIAQEYAGLHKLDLIEENPDTLSKDRTVKIYANDIYSVSLRVGVEDKVCQTREGITQLGIWSHDGTARHDWRDMQAIKNQLVGEEVEGFELFPAESRHLDPSNYYSIWCFPGLKRIRVGQDERRIFDIDESWSPQRRLATQPSRDTS